MVHFSSEKALRRCRWHGCCAGRTQGEHRENTIEFIRRVSLFTVLLATAAACVGNVGGFSEDPDEISVESFEIRTRTCRATPDPSVVGEVVTIVSPDLGRGRSVEMAVTTPSGTTRYGGTTSAAGEFVVEHMADVIGAGTAQVFLIGRNRNRLVQSCSFETITERCSPMTCTEAMVTCGVIDDGCGGMLDCGRCPAVCGDSACDVGEDCASCAADCGACPPEPRCGDGTCDEAEDCMSCTADCGVCGGPLSATAVQEYAPAVGDAQNYRSRGETKVVWAAGRYVVFWERQPHDCVLDGSYARCTPTGNELMATEVSASGAIMGDARLLLDFSARVGHLEELASLDVHAHGGGFVATWVQHEADPAVDQVWYMMLNHSLEVTGIENFDAMNANQIDVFGDATTMAMLWDTNTPHQRNYIASLSSTGTLGSPRRISAPFFAHEIAPEAAWDGGNFGWVWESDRSYLAGCACSYSYSRGPVEVMFTLLGPDGSQRDTITLSEGIEEGLEFISGLQITPRPTGGFMVTWISSSRGNDVVVAVVDAAGRKVGTNHYVTTDGNTVFQTTPHISRATDRSGYFVSWAFGGTERGNHRGIAARRIDDDGVPMGTRTEVLPDELGGCTRGTGSSSSGTYYPYIDRDWCAYTLGFKSRPRATAVGGAGGALVLWPSAVTVTVDVAERQANTSVRDFVFGSHFTF